MMSSQTAESQTDWNHFVDVHRTNLEVLYRFLGKDNEPEPGHNKVARRQECGILEVVLFEDDFIHEDDAHRR